MQKAQVSASRPRSFSLSPYPLHSAFSSFFSFPICLTSFLKPPWLPFPILLIAFLHLPWLSFFILLDDLTSRQVRFPSPFCFFRLYETGQPLQLQNRRATHLLIVIGISTPVSETCRFCSTHGANPAPNWEFVTPESLCWEIVTPWLGFCHSRLGNLSHLLFLLGILSRFLGFRQGICHAHIGVLSRSCWEFVT
jgi:hypothetical protein